ncbi:hypothetical protein GCM10022381_10220 [Leifsonia kafniensis]|uniref:DUF2231 domain-containing protein n=1 Tax=Leifsonia kafniensis TaxID=475957 RepID=A0ABP7K834_9MICO
MDIYQVNGLPLHVLLVHVVVILVPATALCLVLFALWPAARRRLGIVMAILGAIVIAVVPVTAQAGQWLKDRVADTPRIDAHANLARGLWPWTLALGILAIASWLWYFFLSRRDTQRAPRAGTRRAIAILIAVLAIGIGGYATYQTVLIGEAGSRAIWENSFSDTPLR